MKTFIITGILSIATATLCAQEYLTFFGLKSNGGGVIGWDQSISNDSAGIGLESAGSGHGYHDTISQILPGAYYYFSTNDYAHFDTLGTHKGLVLGKTGHVGFPSLMQKLAEKAIPIDQLSMSIGLVSLGGDVLNEDYFFNGKVETMRYRPAGTDGYYYILLNRTDTIVGGIMPDFYQVINHKGFTINDMMVRSVSEATIPIDRSAHSLPVAKDLAAALLKDLGNYGLRIEINSIELVGLMQHISRSNGRYSHSYNVSGKLRKGEKLICGEVPLSADFTPSVSVNQLSLAANLSTDANLSYFWNFGDGITSNKRDPGTHDYSSVIGAGKYDVCLTVYDHLSGCKEVACKAIQVGANACEANFEILQSGDTVRCINKNLLSVNTKWYWEFGDGETSTEKSPVHRYKRNGKFTIRLTTLREGQSTCSDYAEQTVTVGKAVKAGFRYYVNLKEKEVVFNQTSEGSIGKFFWDFGQGQVSVNPNPTRTFSKLGSRKVCLTVVDTTGLLTDRYCKQVFADSVVQCNADFTAFVDSATNMVSFINRTLGSKTKLHWEFGNGGFSNEANPVHTYKAPGYYKVSLTVMDGVSGCMDRSEQLVLVGNQEQDCEADFVYIVDSVQKQVQCFNKSYGKGSTSVHWDFGDGQTTTTENPVYNYFDRGFLYVCLKIRQAGCSNITCKTIQLKEAGTGDCLSDFVYTIDSAGKSISLKEQALGTLTDYSWDFGDGQTSTELNPDHAYDQNGLYRVHLRVGNQNATCFHDFIDYVNVGLGNVGLQCVFGYRQLDQSDFNKGVLPIDFKGAAYGDEGEVTWDFGDGTTNTTSISPVHEYEEEGTYYVCYAIYDSLTLESDTFCDSVEVVSTNIRPYTPNRLSMNHYPSPAQDQVYVVYALEQPAEVTLEVRDLSGRLVERVFSESKTAGKYSYQWNSSSLRSGLYYLKLKTAGAAVVSKLLITD